MIDSEAGKAKLPTRPQRPRTWKRTVLHRLTSKLFAATRHWQRWQARHLGWLFTLLLPVPVAHAQYRFDAWTADNGLPQNSVIAIHQTRDRYLWLTTSDGLVRFDGVRFTVFNKSNTPGINTNRFTALYEDRDGALWVGTLGEGVVRYWRGEFTAYGEPQGLPRGHIRAVTGDAAGNLWALAENRVWQLAGDKFLPASVAGFPNNQWLTFQIIHRENRSGFWSQGATRLALFVRGRVITYGRREGMPEGKIRSVAEDQHGAFWATTDTGLVLHLRDGKVARVYTATDGVPGRLTAFVAGPELKLAGRDAQANLHLINLDSWERQIISHAPALSLENPNRLAFYEDSEGNLWIGSDGGGLFRMRRQAITVYAQKDGLRDRNIYPVLEDHAGAIWVGAWPSTVSRIKDGQVTNYTKRAGLSGEEITALFEDRAGRLWVGAFGNNNGLRLFQNGRFVTPAGLRDLGTVSAIYQDHAGALWFGSEQKLARYHNGALQTWTTKDGLVSHNINVIIEGAAGDLWIGALGGLMLYRQGRFTSFTERDGLPSNSVRALYEDGDGVLWIGTYDGGLGRYANGRFTRYTTREGLHDNGVFQILEDARGHLWMSCNRGIYCVRKQELNELAVGQRNAVTSVTYGKRDGLLSAECNGGRQPGGIKARDGRLWFPTQDGVAVINPATISANPQPPPVMIESFLLDRVPVPVDRPVQIKPGQENFEVRYTALSLINSEQIKFKYKLEGLDHDWIEAGTRRTAYYPHVPLGNYVFRVIAANSDGVWNTEGKSLAVSVLPPFYRTWWFLTLIILGVGTAVGASVRYRIKQLHQRQAQQQAFARELIASQESERKRIAAELHDSLGQHLLIIKNRAMLGERVAQEHTPAREQFAEITASATQAIGEVRQIAYNLRPLNLDRLGLTAALEEMVEKVAAASGVEFSADIEPLDGLLAAEAQINLYRVVQESINNIVRHAAATKANVEIWRADGHLHVTVRDNGRGLNTEAPARRGLGLTSITERVRILSGTHTINSAPNQGTTINISIPVAQTNENVNGAGK